MLYVELHSLCAKWYIVSPGLVLSQATLSPRERQEASCNAVPRDSLQVPRYFGFNGMKHGLPQEVRSFTFLQGAVSSDPFPRYIAQTDSPTSTSCCI